ncbi:hypothetical protein EJ03DRAFT_350166 [Teratosphaeria nubilosa]|uniref:Carboxymuconolactone decarboxylase-like domain-containing protein n=1 Tax=Teratosphaeria nubilosa TaxID=161662 RepID=A0A6G1LDE5_9PEZI|nr:hypothetical protein EJ03DRAFT_350166 [Teratosphaeria nubilosa]
MRLEHFSREVACVDGELELGPPPFPDALVLQDSEVKQRVHIDDSQSMAYMCPAFVLGKEALRTKIKIQELSRSTIITKSANTAGGRLPPNPREKYSTEEEKNGHDHLTAIASQAFGPSGEKFIWHDKQGALIGPFPFFNASPEVGRALTDAVVKLAAVPGLPAESRETAILAVGAHYKAGFELYSHVQVANKATKLSEKQVGAIASATKPSDLGEQEDVAYDVAKYLAATPGPMPQDLWDRSMKAFGKDGTVALVHYVGLYVYTCVILNAIDAPVP